MTNKILLALFFLFTLSACSDPEGERRLSTCKTWGVRNATLLDECKRSQAGARKIIDPIRKQKEMEEVAIYNAGVKQFATFSPETINETSYESISLQGLSKKCCFVNLGAPADLKQHPLYWKRFKVSGDINYWKREWHGEEKREAGERFSVEAKDESNKNNVWMVDADIESLNRREREFIRNYCDGYWDRCKGEVYGVIGILSSRDELDLGSLGLQIEHIILYPMKVLN